MQLGKVIFAAALVHGAAAADSCAAHLGECKTKKPLPRSKWWHDELYKSQELCASVDPDGSGTCHQWTNQLSKKAQDAVLDIKTTVANHIKDTMRTDDRHRTLAWNDQMDELYLSAPKHGEGSDKVFITPHIDGFFGWIPFMTAFRCVYGLTGPHETVTLQPMRAPEEREINLSPGRFTCFDYNREVHWIEHRELDEANNSERMVLKLHFYEYPKLLQNVADMFGDLNAQYNFFARRMFLLSQFPDRSWISKQVGRVINGITLYGGNAESWFGYMNIGIVLLLLAAVSFRPYAALATAGSVHLGIYIFGYAFRSVPFGMFVRDCVAFKSFAMALLAYTYISESLKRGFNPLSLGVAAAGFGMAGMAYSELGPDLAYYGVEFGVFSASHEASVFPASVPFPMIVGSIFGLIGLRLHPEFGAKFHGAFKLQVGLYTLLAVLETYNVHVPASHAYENTLNEFLPYHQVPGNAIAHLVTTGISVLGVLGLAANAVTARAAPAKGAAPAAPKIEAPPAPVAPVAPVAPAVPPPAAANTTKPKVPPKSFYDDMYDYVFGNNKAAVPKPAAPTPAPPVPVVPVVAKPAAPKPSPSLEAASSTADEAPVVLKTGVLFVALSWVLVRYTVPDDDAGFATVGMMALLAAINALLRPSNATSVALIAVGVGAQEYAHMHFKEVTYMSSYASISLDAALTFALHNLWLLPFEIRATIGTLTESVFPAKAI